MAQEWFGQHVSDCASKQRFTPAAVAHILGISRREVLDLYEGKAVWPEELIQRLIWALDTSSQYGLAERYRECPQLKPAQSQSVQPTRFGVVIRLIRELKGLSQKEVAKQAGWSSGGALNHLEKGRHPNTTIERVRGILNALGVDDQVKRELAYEACSLTEATPNQRDDLAEVVAMAVYGEPHTPETMEKLQAELDKIFADWK